MRIRKFFLIAIAAYLGGCCGSPFYLRPAAKSIPEGKSLVFGEISVISDVKPKSIVYFDMEFQVIDIKSSEVVFVHQIKRYKGPFYWLLPPGQYAILNMAVRYREGSIRKTSWQRIYAEFTVDSPSLNIYIGDLYIDWIRKSRFVTLKDDYDKALRVLHADYPNLQGVSVKRLLKLEEEP